MVRTPWTLPTAFCAKLYINTGRWEKYWRLQNIIESHILMHNLEATISSLWTRCEIYPLEKTLYQLQNKVMFCLENEACTNKRWKQLSPTNVNFSTQAPKLFNANHSYDIPHCREGLLLHNHKLFVELNATSWSPIHYSERTSLYQKLYKANLKVYQKVSLRQA